MPIGFHVNCWVSTDGALPDTVRVEIREYLNLTITFDHDVVDGAPAARFAQRLKLRHAIIAASAVSGNDAARDKARHSRLDFMFSASYALFTA